MAVDAPMTRAALIEALETALETAKGADRGLFIAAFDCCHPAPCGDVGDPVPDAYYAWLRVKDRFCHLLNTDAYLDAAMMLTPAYSNTSINIGPSGVHSVNVIDPGGEGIGVAATPANAYLDAALMLKPAGWMVTHLSELGAAGGCVCAIGNPATSQEAVSDHGARTLAPALAAACLRAGGE